MSESERPISDRENARYGAANTGVPVDWAPAVAGARRSAMSAILRIGLGLRDMFGHDPDTVVDDLKEPAAYTESAGAVSLADGQLAIAKEGHHRRVPGQHADRPIV